MLTKICLIIALVAGLGALGVGHFLVNKRILTTEADRDQFAQERDRERSEKVKTQTELKQTKDELSTTKTELAQTQQELQTKTTELADAQQKVTGLNSQLTKANQEISTLKQDYKDFLALNMKAAVIRDRLVELKNTKEELEATKFENHILSTNLAKAENKIIELTNAKVRLPEGLTGNIKAVDPLYQFVVLDIGSNQGVKQNGEMLVSRDGKLIGRVRISNVEPNHSIANILKDWKKGEVYEGDEVKAFSM